MSKISFYIHRFDNQYDFDFLLSAIDAGVTSVKIEGQFEAVRQAKKRNPNLVVVYRNIVNIEGDDEHGFRQDFKPGESDVQAAVTEHMRLVKADTGGNIPAGVFICNPYNEVGLDDPKLRIWMGDFEEERQRRYKAKGYGAAIMSVGVKANLHDKLGGLEDAFRLAYAYGNVIDLHAYNSKRLDDNGPYNNDISEGLMPHRLLYDALTKLGIGVARFFFGEGGHDAVKSSGKEGPGYNGFRDIGLSNEVVVQDWQYWEELFVRRVLGVRVGFQHPADKLLIGIGSFIFSDAPPIQPDYNTKWSSGKGSGFVPGVAYLWLDWVRGNKGDPVPPATSGPVTPPPVDPPIPPPTTYPWNGRTNANLNARLGTSDGGTLLATIPSGTPVKVLASDGHRVTIEVSVLAENVKPI